MDSSLMIWGWIALCLVQSGIFSGLNIGLYSLSTLELEAASEGGDFDAKKVLKLRRKGSLLLATILWGNVGVNCLLTMLSNSVLAGAAAFIFSTFLITLFGEIFPQAYFSRYALKVGAFLSPLVHVYIFLLYPISKPTSLVLNKLLGDEEFSFFRERDLRIILKKHVDDEDTDISRMEGIGAINFLSLDDIPVSQEGEPVDPRSILSLPTHQGRVIFPEISKSSDDPFLQKVNASGKKWIVLVDESNEPRLVLNSDDLMRDVIYGNRIRTYYHCHRPIIVRRSGTNIGNILQQLTVEKAHAEDDVIDNDLILYWGEEEKRIVTGADILGRLLRGIVKTVGTTREQKSPLPVRS